jgi:trigger factor
MEIAEKKIEELEHSRVRLTITVPAASVRAEYDAMMQEYAREARIDGFRKGHVPVSVLERKFGPALKTEAMGRVIEKAVETGLKDAERQPLTYEPPAVDGDPSFELDKDFTFSVTYDTFPSFELPALEGISIEVPRVAVTEEDIARELEAIRQRNAIVIEKEGPAEMGDIVTADFEEIDETGQPVPGTARSDFSFELGKQQNIYKFDEEIVGLKSGDEKTFTKTFPTDYEFQEYAGKTLTLKARVKKVKKQDLPALDDELAQDVSEEYKTLDDLKAAVRKQLEASLEARLRTLKEHAILDELLKRTKVEIPRSMLAAELAMRWESLKRQMGVDSDERMDLLAQISGRSRDQLFKDWAPQAEKALASRILLDKLVEAGGYTASDEEVNAEIAKEAAHTTMSPEEIKAEYEKHGSLEYLKDDIKVRKFFDAVLASAEIREGESRSYMDFMKESE